MDVCDSPSHPGTSFGARIGECVEAERQDNVEEIQAEENQKCIYSITEERNDGTRVCYAPERKQARSLSCLLKLEVGEDSRRDSERNEYPRLVVR